MLTSRFAVDHGIEKGCLFQSAELLGYSSMKEKQIEAVTAFVEGMILLVQAILKPHSITKYDVLHTSVQKKTGHSEQLDHASLTRPLFLNRPAEKEKKKGLARETSAEGPSLISANY